MQAWLAEWNGQLNGVVTSTIPVHDYKYGKTGKILVHKYNLNTQVPSVKHDYRPSTGQSAYYGQLWECNILTITEDWPCHGSQNINIL